ncbi:MAG: chromosomal replication initiator protein DnaA [Clostridia bacterium]|nr:chromosomal replication initiator protein DnaA [Clostridia bacterium]
MDELHGITEAILPVIEKKIGAAPSIFNLWFGEFKLYSLTDTKAVFTTPTKLKKKILLTKYINVIKNALEDAIGFPVKVEILSIDDINGPTFVEYVDEDDEDEIPRPDPAEEDDGKEEIIAEFISGTSEKHTLLDDYTFDNFVVGSSNTFAKAACMAVANEPTAYNPLFIYGNSGLGKTHLLYAVINHMKYNHPDLKIVYKKCETFLEELIEAIQSGFVAPFKEKYRRCDVLLIDDIQFLAGKEATQEEFFHTFSALYESDKQIILTSDRPPKDIKPLEDRLRTRFEGGLLADVQPPNFELRIAIIRKKSDDMGLSISNEMVEYMAERLQNNIRQIEGALKRLYAVCSFTSSEVTKERIDEVISIIDPGNIPTDAMIERILTTVSKHYGIDIESLKSKKKTDSVAKVRHVAIYLIRKLTSLTLKEIGGIFGRDHATVMASIDKVEINIKTVNGYEREIKRLIKEIKG